MGSLEQRPHFTLNENYLCQPAWSAGRVQVWWQVSSQNDEEEMPPFSIWTPQMWQEKGAFFEPTQSECLQV